MRYDTNKNRIITTAQELVSLSRPKKATHETESALPTLLSGAKTEGLLYEKSGMRYEISAAAHTFSESGVLMRFQIDTPIPDADTSRQARGEAFVCAFILAQKYDVLRPLIQIEYHFANKTLLHEEMPTRADLVQFFEGLLTSLLAEHAALLDRVCRRLPTLAAVKYPFAHLREGQGQLIRETYAALRRKKRLFACAPTGIGKTMSTLYPAIRAVGEGVFEKAFYFTSKNTGAISAKEAAEKLYQNGADLRGVCIGAKERLCSKDLFCRSDVGFPYYTDKKAKEREKEAIADMLESKIPVFDGAAIAAVAEKYALCPYELSLAYSEVCDLVILDYNYLFDSRVFLRRFFEKGGEYAFLVDEAHNLPARVTEAFSQDLCGAELLEMVEVFSESPEMQKLLTLAAAGIDKTVDQAVSDDLRENEKGEKHGFCAENAQPSALLSVYKELFERAFMIACDTENHTAPYRRRARKCAYALKTVCEKMERYDERFITFYERAGEQRLVRLLCLDGAAIMDERLSKGTAAVLFSATLHPLSYYRDVCGGSKADPMLELDSPFEKEQTCITVLDRIPVRYSARENSLRKVLRAILTTVKAKPGNYMVFCPSFAYLDALKEALKKAVPGLAVLSQSPSMSQKERKDFLAAFDADNKKALIGLCVLGGIYGEGVDLVGKRLIGTVIVGVGLPPPTNEREAMRAYFENRYEMGTAYAYAYPGLNRVLQAAGRVIRDENDKGVIVLIDDRLSEPVYKEMLPSFWHTLAYAGNEAALAARLARFWQK
ncbi:MAG: ATP-dependent DNA helicase [Clostridia bacterium]|nr:ATP-dependent DNA helicase [Clostridia bacterium]